MDIDCASEILKRLPLKEFIICSSLNKTFHEASKITIPIDSEMKSNGNIPEKYQTALLYYSRENLDIINLLDYRKYKRVNLYKCKNIICENLVYIDYLTIFGCKKIANISMFRHIRRLEIMYCKWLTNVDSLCNIEILYIIGCEKVTDTSALGYIKNLAITESDSIVDVSYLGNVKIPRKV